MNATERLQEIEIRLTFVDDAVTSLTSADADLAQRLAALERVVTELRRELASVRGGLGHDFHDEPPPPHY